MKKIVILVLALVFLIGGLQVAAKGGGGAGAGSGMSSGGAQSSGGGAKSESSSKAAGGEKGEKSYPGSMAGLEKEMAASGIAQQFRTRLMEQLRLRLDQECAEAEKRGEEIGVVQTREMVSIARRAATQKLSPEATAGICTAFQASVWAGVPSRFGETLAAEGLRMNQPAEQVENALRVTARLRREFRNQTPVGEEDEEVLEELGRKMAAVCHREQLEARLRELLQNGYSFTEAVERLSD